VWHARTLCSYKVAGTASASSGAQAGSSQDAATRYGPENRLGAIGARDQDQCSHARLAAATRNAKRDGAVADPTKCGPFVKETSCIRAVWAAKSK